MAEMRDIEKSLMCVMILSPDNVKRIIELVDAGADVNAQDADGITALMLAVANGVSLDVLRMLGEAGADDKANAEIVMMDFMPSMMSFAARKPSVLDVIRMLSDARADMKARDSGWTALMFAAQNNAKPGIVRMLIEVGADVNAKDHDHTTVLMHAAKNDDNPDVIRTLIDAGADVNAADFDGPVLLHATSFSDNPDVFRMLIEAGAYADDIDMDKLDSVMFNSENPYAFRAILELMTEDNLKVLLDRAQVFAARINANIEIIKDVYRGKAAE